MPDFITDCDSFLPRIEAGTEYVSSAADVFGQGGTLAEGVGDISAPRILESVSLTDSVQYDVLVCAVFVMLCYILYNYSGSIKFLFSVLLKKKASSDKLLDEQSQFFRQFMIVSLIMGALLIGGMVTKIGDMYGFFSYVNPVSPRLAEWFCLIVVGIAGVVTLYKILAINILGVVTGDKSFFAEHHSMSRCFFVGSAIIIAPLFLLFAFSYGTIAYVLMYLSLGVAAVMYLIFIFKSYRFFLERNVSILQWILYLCAVEFFPISFLLLLGLRNV